MAPGLTSIFPVAEVVAGYCALARGARLQRRPIV